MLLIFLNERVFNINPYIKNVDKKDNDRIRINTFFKYIEDKIKSVGVLIDDIYNLRMYIYSRTIANVNSSLGIVVFPSNYSISIAKKYPKITKFIIGYYKAKRLFFKKFNPFINYDRLSRELSTSVKMGEAVVDVTSKHSSITNVAGAKELQEVLIKHIGSRTPAFIHGAIAQGKTEILSSIAAINPNCEVISIPVHLAHTMFEDIAGMTAPSMTLKDATTMLKQYFMSNIEYHANNTKTMVLIFLDEYTRAPLAIRNIILTALDSSKKIGIFRLPKNSVIIAAGNRKGDDPEDDDAIIALTSAEKDRFVTHYNFHNMAEDVIDWAQKPLTDKDVKYDDENPTLYKEVKTDATIQTKYGEVNLTKAKATNYHPFIVGFLEWEIQEERIALYKKSDIFDVRKYKDKIADRQYVDSLMHIDTDVEMMTINTPRKYARLSLHLYQVLLDSNEKYYNEVISGKITANDSTYLNYLSATLIKSAFSGLMEDTIKYMINYLLYVKLIDLKSFKEKFESDKLNTISDVLSKAEFEKIKSSNPSITISYDAFSPKIVKLLINLVNKCKDDSDYLNKKDIVRNIIENSRNVNESLSYNFKLLNEDLSGEEISNMMFSLNSDIVDEDYIFIQHALFDRLNNPQAYYNFIKDYIIIEDKVSGEVSSANDDSNYNSDETEIEIINKIITTDYSKTNYKVIDSFIDSCIIDSTQITEAQNYYNIIKESQLGNIITTEEYEYLNKKYNFDSIYGSSIKVNRSKINQSIEEINFKLTDKYYEKFNKAFNKFSASKKTYDNKFNAFDGTDLYYFDKEFINVEFNKFRDANPEKPITDFIKNYTL